MGKKNKPIIALSLFALVATAGVAYLSSGFQKWDLTDWKDKVKPILPGTSEDISEDPTTSEEPITSEEPVTSEEPITSEEPVTSEDPVFGIEDFLELPVLTSFNLDVWEGDNESYFTSKGMSKTTYKNLIINDFHQGASLDFNSVRFEGTSANALKFGFPGTVTDIHTTNEFGTGYTYASYMVINGIFEYNQSDEIVTSISDHNGEPTSLFTVYARTDNHLTWTPFANLNSFNQEAEFIQFAIAYQTNNKSTNAMLTYFDIRVNSTPDFVVPDNTYGIQILGGHSFYDEEGNFTAFGTTYYHKLTNYNDFLIIDVENPDTAVFPTENSFAVSVSDVLNDEIYFSFIFSQEPIEVPEGKTNVVLTPKKVAVIELLSNDPEANTGTFDVSYRDLVESDFLLVNYSL